MFLSFLTDDAQFEVEKVQEGSMTFLCTSFLQLLSYDVVLYLL